MWHTSQGDRTLIGDEAALVSRAIDVMVGALLVHVDEDFEDEDFEDLAPDCETGIPVYDLCLPSQRIALLHDVAKHLLTDTDSTLPLSALTDATVAAVFVEVRDQIAIEIGFSAELEANGALSWREMVLAAHRSVFPDRDGDRMGAVRATTPRLSLDLPSWELLVDELADSVLWDRDYEMAEGFLDVDPGVSQQRRRLLGIDDDYFTQVAPDPRSDQVYDLVAQTQSIVRSRPR